MGHTERLWPARLRWRLRGAWLWPAFTIGTLVDGILLSALPPYDGVPPGLVGCLLLAGFANLFLIAVAAPLAGRRLRRRRPDLPRPIAGDYAGAALIAVLTLVILVAGVLHRPAVAAHRDDDRAMLAAVAGYVATAEPGWAHGLLGLEVRGLAPDVYRACIPGRDPRRWLCLIVDTDRRPVQVTRDDSMKPNE